LPAAERDHGKGWKETALGCDASTRNRQPRPRVSHEGNSLPLTGSQQTEALSRVRAPDWNLTETGPLPHVVSDLLKLGSVGDAIGAFAEEMFGRVDSSPDVADISPA
jgi:hypothetical protein